MKKICLILFILFIHSICCATPSSQKLLARSKQLIVVTTPNWESVNGSLQRYERDSTQAAWKAIGKSVPVVIGKNGMSIGLIKKKEGDGKTPEGIYTLGSAFGFDANTHYKINYQQLVDTSICVDDVKSVYYNQLIDSAKVAKKDWNSGEQMREVPGYKSGIVVKYNENPVIRGAGSCIFMHIWKNPETGTAGCIAMDETHLDENLDWLDAKKHPVIAIFPMQVYKKLKLVDHV